MPTMMKEEASEKKEQKDVDCYKSFEVLLLACFYTILTGLYLTASTMLQFGFVAVVSATMLVTECRKKCLCKEE